MKAQDLPAYGRPTRVESMNVWHRVQTRLVPTSEWTILPTLGELAGGLIPRGGGMSFSDAAMHQAGHTLQTAGLDELGEVDRETDEMWCGAGVPLGVVAKALQNSGLGLPVAGGTRNATVGGAIAADIHGKNDRVMGSFGHHTREIELQLVDGRTVRCSPTEQPDLFAATVGGMGLTGVILRARIGLVPRDSLALRWESVPFEGLAGMQACFEESDAPWQAAWVDATAPVLRGHHHRARPDPGPAPAPGACFSARIPPLRLLSLPLLKMVNRSILGRPDEEGHRVHLWDFVWSTDRFLRWHRLYGPRGCDEFQFAAPPDTFPAALEAMRQICEDAGVRPYFSMIKRLGGRPRVGLLSFPIEGFTVTANFPHTSRNAGLFQTVMDALIPLGGRGYLAKDTTMTAEQYAASTPNLPRWQEIVRGVDPGGVLQSDLSLRLGLKPW